MNGSEATQLTLVDHDSDNLMNVENIQIIYYTYSYYIEHTFVVLV